MKERFTLALQDAKNPEYALKFFRAKFQGVCALTGMSIVPGFDMIANSQIGYVCSKGLEAAGIGSLAEDVDNYVTRAAERSHPYDAEKLIAWAAEGKVALFDRHGDMQLVRKEGDKFVVGNKRPCSEKQLRARTAKAVWIRKY